MPNTTSNKNLQLLLALCIGAPLGAQTTPLADGSEALTLEEFVVRESALANLGELTPTSRPVSGLYGDGKSVLEIPRSVTVLTPELIRQFNINSFADLSKIGAGTQQINYYGVPGTPALRGAKGSTYFNGMMRAFNRNEMPLSFGSLDAIDVVKGPAPAHFGPGLVGGYVNLIPKLPYFDRFRGSVKATVGSNNHYNLQTDIGGPTEIAGHPAAYRVSLTGQIADSYYDRIGNDYISLYASMKSEVAKGITVFTGGEFFDFKSNENAGWNRPTQNLIDNGEYIIGEPASIISPLWGGNAVRSIAEFPGQYWTNPLLQALAIPGTIARERIPAAQLALMANLNTQAGLDRVYSVNPDSGSLGIGGGSVAAAEGLLRQVGITPQDSYVYTPEYFAAGGEVLTEKIDGSTVLSDDSDYADSKNFFYFLDIENKRPADLSVKNQFIMEFIETSKLSTYGYAIDTEQFVFENKLSVTQAFDFLKGMNLTYGVSGRYTDAEMLQDFFAEPFSRRDITRDQVSTNSIILTGPQRGPDGLNFWSPTSQGGANAHSKLWQFSLFAVAENKWTDWLTTYSSILGAHAPYTTAYPDEVDQVPDNSPIRDEVTDHKNYYSAAFSPTITVAPGVNLYATIQRGTAVDPLQGGAIVGKGNFSKNQLLEAGIKTSLLEDKLFASVAVYRWKQTAFDDRTNNAEPLKGKGIEFESTWLPAEGFALIGSVAAQRVQRETALGFRAFPLTDEEWALWAGSLNSQFGPAVFDPDEGAIPSNNPDLIYPGTPEVQAKLFARYQHSSGLGISGGPIWSQSYWHNIDRTLKIPSSLVWNLNVFYDLEKWSFLVSVENLTSEDYFAGSDPIFAANTVITKAPEEPQWKVSATYRF